MNKQTRAVMESVLLGIGAAILVLLLSYVPLLNMFILLWPVPMIVLGVKRDIGWGMVSLLVSGVVLSLFVPSLSIIAVVGAVAIAVVAVTFALSKRLVFYESILLSIGAVLAAVLSLFKAYALIAGQSVFDVLWNFVRQMFTGGAINIEALLEAYHELGLFKNFTTNEQLAEFFISQMKMTVPAAILTFSLIYGIILLMVSYRIAKRWGCNLRDFPSFDRWELPKGMGLGLAILLLVSVLGRNLKIANFEIVQLTVTSLIAFIFTIQGLAVVWYYLKSAAVPAVLRWLLIILTYIFVSLLTFNLGLSVLGVIDYIFKLRANHRKRRSGSIS